MTLGDRFSQVRTHFFRIFDAGRARKTQLFTPPSTDAKRRCGKVRSTTRTDHAQERQMPHASDQTLRAPAPAFTLVTEIAARLAAALGAPVQSSTADLLTGLADAQLRDIGVSRQMLHPPKPSITVKARVMAQLMEMR
jgi:hypothetical protein